MRQYVFDPGDDVPATVHIRREPAAGPPPVPDDGTLARQIGAARRFFGAM